MAKLKVDAQKNPHCCGLSVRFAKGEIITMTK